MPLPQNLITGRTAKLPGVPGDLKKQPTPHWTHFARGKRRTGGEMNKTEAAYAAHLEGLVVLGHVEWFVFESVTFKLAQDCRYTPDFLVLLPSGYLEVHEVKAFWADDARVKIKVAAEKFPFRFVAVKRRAKKDGGGWEREEFGRPDLTSADVRESVKELFQ